ncbi:response regulator [Paenibacillus sp. MMS20-IR301]|uniref:response regulator n=1 Tax=Paenibacillus sp. MMS20-IR301 TaxID=2895946 RepID=UPI0028E6FDFD|nr:response regulator [Paenibacillus sp. MMS20-IR301]WNS46054.1 response regulator [Paenibacillus sp. MMS20-IR301]
MYKVVLADDETIALEGLLSLTDWEELGFEICGACENGEAALAVIAQSKPDLVITDIRMPGIDGLELIRRVRGLEIEQPIFIVLSGYGEFEYARTAIRYGVKHYLLKPVIEAEWDKALADITDELELRLKQKMQQSMLASRLLPLAIARILQGHWAEPEEEATEQMDRLDEAATGWIYLHVEGDSGTITRICRELAGPAGALFIDLPGGQAGLVVETPEAAAGLAQQIHAELSLNGVRGSVSIGPSVRSLRELPVSYSEAADAAARNYFYSDGTGQSGVSSDAKDRQSYLMPAAGMIAELISAVERLQEQKVQEKLNEMFRVFKEQRTAPGVVQMTGMDILLKSTELLKEFGGDEDQWSSSLEFFRTEPKSLETLHATLQIVLTSCMNMMRQHKERSSEHPLTRVEYFLKDNYARHLTVKEIAEHFYINPVYLGQAFIKKHGISILEYIHNLRIEAAKKRLLQTNDTVRSIVESVGYVHYHHFLREFEKRTALKPVAFREQAQSTK